MAAERDIRYTLGYRYDPTGERQYTAAVRRLQAEQQREATTRRALNAAYQQGTPLLRAVSNATVGYATAVDQWAEIEERARSNAERLNDTLTDRYKVAKDAAEAQEAFNAVMANIDGRGPGAGRGTGGGSGRQQSVTDRIDRAGRFGSQIASGLGAPELANAAGLFGDLSDAIGTLGPVGVAATGALAGLSVGIGLLNQQLGPAVRNLEAARVAQSRYYAALGTLTDEQARAQIAELERANALIRQQFTETRSALDANVSGIGATIVNGLAGLNVEFAQAIVGVSAEADRLQAELAANEQTIVRLTQGLEAGAFAANTATEAELLLAQQRQQAAQQFVSTVTTTITQSREEVQARIAALQAEAEGIERVLEVGYFQNEESVTAFTDRLNQLRNEIDVLNVVILPLVDSTSKATATTLALGGAIDRVAALSERLAREEELQAAAQKKQVDALRAAGQAREAVAKAERDYATAQAEARARLEEAQQQANADQARLVDDYNRDRIRAEEDLQDELRRILRDSAFELLNAQSNRDALTFTLARRRRDQELQDQQQNATKAAQRRRDDFNRQQTELQQAAARRLLQERTSAANELNTRRQALMTAQQQLAQALNAQRGLSDIAYSSMTKATQTFANNAIAAANQLLSWPGRGGFPRSGNIFGGGTGSQPLPFVRTSAPTINLNIQGAQMTTVKATSRQQAEAVMLSTLRDFFR